MASHGSFAPGNEGPSVEWITPTSYGVPQSYASTSGLGGAPNAMQYGASPFDEEPPLLEGTWCVRFDLLCCAIVHLSAHMRFLMQNWA